MNDKTDKTDKTDGWSELWLAFKRGDMDAFQQIYSAFFDKLYAYGSKLMLENTVLEDSIQELFLNLYTSRKKLATPENLEFYLLKSLKLTIYQKQRKQKKFIKTEINETQNSNLGFLFAQESVQDETEKDEQLSKMLESLDVHQRELIYLKFYKNLSYKEIGSLLGVQADSAKKQVYRIITRLKNKFSNVAIELFLYFMPGR